MQARICDKCKNVIEGNLPAYPPMEVNEDHVKLIITVGDNVELCPTCVKKEQYKAAKTAFDQLKSKKERKTSTGKSPNSKNAGAGKKAEKKKDAGLADPNKA
jgi:hypothetical protein